MNNTHLEPFSCLPFNPEVVDNSQASIADNDVRVDYLSCTFPFNVGLEKLRTMGCPVDDDVLWDYIQHMGIKTGDYSIPKHHTIGIIEYDYFKSLFSFLGVDLLETTPKNGYLRGYQFTILDEESLFYRLNLGSIFIGGNKNADGVETCQLLFTGKFFDYLYPRNRVAYLYHALDYLGVSIRRLDLQLNDYDGSVSVDDVVDLYNSGDFTVRKSPRFSQIGDWSNGDSDNLGRTVYIGSRQSMYYHRSYEKGKQLSPGSTSKYVFHVCLFPQQEREKQK